jgi:hypothetical protein
LKNRHNSHSFHPPPNKERNTLKTFHTAVTKKAYIAPSPYANNIHLEISDNGENIPLLFIKPLSKIKNSESLLLSCFHNIFKTYLPHNKNEIAKTVLCKFNFLARNLNLPLKQYGHTFSYHNYLPIIFLNYFISYKLAVLNLAHISISIKSFIKNIKNFSNNILKKINYFYRRKFFYALIPRKLNFQ